HWFWKPQCQLMTHSDIFNRKISHYWTVGRTLRPGDQVIEGIVAIQRWLYGGMASGLSDVAGGNSRAIVAAMAAAVLFGAVHALMPGHGKTVLVSYHLGQPAKIAEGMANGADACRARPDPCPYGIRGHQQGLRLWRAHAAIRS